MNDDLKADIRAIAASRDGSLAGWKIETAERVAERILEIEAKLEAMNTALRHLKVGMEAATQALREFSEESNACNARHPVISSLRCTKQRHDDSELHIAGGSSWTGQRS